MYRLACLLIVLMAASVVGIAPGVARAGCPSEQSVMTSNSGSAENGYMCAQEDHSGEMSIGADKTHSWNKNVDPKMYPHYYCHPRTSSDVSVTGLATWGAASFTATNWLTPSNTRDWTVGVLWTAGDYSVTGFDTGCSVNSQTFDNPPEILKISTISASGIPTGGATAGQTYPISIKVTTSQDAGTVAIQDNGVSVASATLTSGKATIYWTPAVDGTSKLTAVYKGNGWNTPATTKTYSVPVTGGTGVSIDDVGLIPGSTTQAQASVTVSPATTTGMVALIDTATKAAVGQGAIVNGVATVKFPYKIGKSYTFIAKYTGTPVGQAYPYAWNSPAAASSISASGIPTGGAVAGKTYPIKVTVTTKADGGRVGIRDNGVDVASADLTSGKATINWIPAVNGTSNIAVVYKGNAWNTPATTPTYTIPVTGGTGVSVSGITLTDGSAASATASVAVTPATTTGTVTLVDASTRATVGQGALTNGVATIDFPYAEGTSYTFVAKYTGSPSGQSYPYAWTSPAAKKLTAAQAASLSEQLTAITDSIAGGVDPQTRTITSTSRGGTAFSMKCPKGEHLINVDAMTSGPVDEIGLASLTSTGVKVQPSAADKGHRVLGQIICRPASAKQVTVGGIAFGTAGPNRIALTAVGTGFGGPGRDHLSSSVAGSSLWGGLGRDTLLVGGASSVGDGGPGADVLIATGSGRHLLVGGLGRDTLVGSFGPDVINARDGHGGDLVDCRSAQTRVVADANDMISGPCIQVDTANGKGTVTP